MSRDAESTINQQDIAARDAVSGVNLDEEAANMLRFQQAYQAAAQIIAVSGQMFDALLNAVRR
jgi:flagellar hook-associated protein 1 FlgK